MSKRIELKITCPNCNTEYQVTVFRTIWGEHEENRNLVMTDKINVVTCPSCHHKIKVPYALMYVDIKKQFAVWWEPAYDAQIDADAIGYAKMFGEGNFYQKAPRIKDWEEFKNTINKYYSGELKANPIKVSPKQEEAFKGLMEGMLKDLKKQNKKKSGCLVMFAFLLIIIATISISIMR
jgi:transcription elongation factor Elf1